MAVPSLSVCVLTRGPAPRVRALLELVRPIATEILLAVDGRGDKATLELCADVVDRSYVLEDALPAHALGWLMHECMGDWILRLDDDEVPSASLLAVLPETLRAKHLTSVALTRRWLYPDRRRYLSSHPWTPDYQLRLVRNLPGIWRFPGLVHDEFHTSGERRFLPHPLYHLDLLLHPVEARRAKRELYESHRPDHATEGFPVNAMYTPEDVEDVEVERVPHEDAELIDRMTEAEAPKSSTRRGRAPRRVDPELAERYFPNRKLSRAAYRAAVGFVRPPRSVGARETQVIELEVENQGDDWWPAGDGGPPIRVAHRWLGAGGSALGPETLSGLPERLGPNSKTRVLTRVRAPVWPGRHVLRVELVHQGARSFGTPAEEAVDVSPTVDRVALGSPEPAPGTGYAAELAPSVERFAMAVAERGRLDISIRNSGTRRWDSSGRAGPPVRASCRWLDERGTVVITDAPRTPLPSPVDPGGQCVVRLDLAAPSRPGRYEIEVDLVEEGVRWYGDPARVTIDVSAPADVQRRLSRARRASRGPRARVRRARAGSIPRAIHRIWLGDAPLPAEFRHYGETWARHHPGWKIRLWGDREAARMIPSSVRRLARSPSELSNLLRYEVLRRFGGIYADTDVECRRPFDPLLDRVDALAGWEVPYRIGSAVLGSVPGHPVFELAALEARVTVGTGLNSVEATGPGFLTQVIAEQPSVAVFDSELFYPYRWDQPHRRNEPFSGSYAVHHWTLSWADEPRSEAAPV